MRSAYADRQYWEIGLIDPDGFDQAARRHRPTTRLLPHLGLGYLAAAIEENGDRASVLDAGVSTHNEVQRFLSQPFHLVGITATSFTIRQALAAARAVKRRYPSTPVVLGGPHASIDPAGCLADPAVDYALRGEGERGLVDLIEVSKRNGRPGPELLSQVPGLIHRGPAGPVINPLPPRLKELDKLPYPAWHLFPMRRYRQHVVLSSRGCPMDCAFCAVRTLWGTEWLRRDPGNVVHEVGWVTSHWGRKVVHINDDNLTADPRHLERVCDGLANLRPAVTWVAQGVRADGLTPALAKRMRRAGCARVSLGIESADPGVLQAVGKRETPEEMAQAVRSCRRAGLTVLGMFMVGNPGDTEETVMASMHWAERWRIDLPAFYMALPYPGTRLWDYVRREGRWLNADYTSFDHMSAEPVFETDAFPAAARRGAYARASTFCRRRLLWYHLAFWWPANLWRRTGREIAQELGTWLKTLVWPFRLLRRARRPRPECGG